MEHCVPAGDDIASIQTQEWEVSQTTKYGVGPLPYLSVGKGGYMLCNNLHDYPLTMKIG